MSDMTHRDDTIPLGLRLTQGRSSDDDDDDDGDIWFGAAPSRSSYLHAHAADANYAEQPNGEALSQGPQQESAHFRDAAPKAAIASTASSSSARALSAEAEEEAHQSRSRKRKSAGIAQNNSLELCRSVAKREFVLSNADLSALAYKECPNPVRAHFAPMQVYDREALRGAAIAKHGSEQGIEAARRARNLHLQSMRATKAARITQQLEEARLFREKHSLRQVSSAISPV